MVGFNLHRYDILLFCHGPTERIYVGIGRHFHGQVVHYGLRRFHGNIEQAPRCAECRLEVGGGLNTHYRCDDLRAVAVGVGYGYFQRVRPKHIWLHP